MKNLIYILIGIVWVAYSLYSARQKAMRKQQSPGMPPTGPSQSSPLPIPGNQRSGRSLLDDIFRELSGEPVPVPARPQAEIAHAPVSPAKNTMNPEMPKRSDGYTRIPTPPTFFPGDEAGKDPKTHVLQQQLTKDESISKKFDLREAVIFSELLNPKYF